MQLLQFLHDRNPQVRQIALSNLLAHTVQGAPQRSLFLSSAPESVTAIRDLKLLVRDQPTIAHDAFRALVNLSDTLALADTSALGDPEWLSFLVSYILVRHSPCLRSIRLVVDAQ